MTEQRDKIVENDVVTELSESFMAYSMSVITSRALPDVRDGLKPVHRRILYGMLEQSILPTGPTRKSAVPVGHVMGRYHPHGDSAIYETLVRMTQDFRMRVPLIYPHGNFGSLDDGPAASRYTECRLNHAGLALLEDIREETVDFRKNYSGEYDEPEVLPAGFPNLIVNGGTGIAVGMASNMAPHNLIEVVEGLKAMILNPNITVDQMLEHIPGPDLPTGATIIDGGVIKEAYETGRGKFRMRATARIEDLTARKKGIIFTSLPFNIGGEKVMEDVKTKVKEGKLLGVADIRDLSSLDHGMKIVVECKTGFNPEAILEDLYRLTSFEDTFGINNVCLVDRAPETLGILGLCKHYLNHRLSVIRRRTEFRLKKAEARAHILEGLIIALASIDDVVKIIRASKDTKVAKAGLIKKFILSDLQADAILEMRLARLTSLEVNKLKSDLKELHQKIKEYKKLLSSEKLMWGVVSDELDVVSEKYGTPRRSKILATAPVVKAKAAALEIPDEPTVVSLNTLNTIGRFDVNVNKSKPTKEDFVTSEVTTTTRATIGAITSRGRLVRQNVIEIPKAEGRSRGGDLKEFFTLENEKIINFVTLEPGQVITMITKAGLVKRLLTEALPNANKKDAPVIGLKDGDELISAHVTKTSDGPYDIIMVTNTAQLLRTNSESITPKGAPAGGMAGMKVAEGAEILATGIVPENDESVNVATLSDGYCYKATKALDYPVKGRGGSGVRCQTFKKGETMLIAASITSKEIYGTVNAKDPVLLDATLSKRDASGIKLEQEIDALNIKRQA